MHELSITEHILSEALAEARKAGGTRIRRIRLVMGPFCTVVPECVQMYLDLLAEGTIAEGAKVDAEVLPLKVRCRVCGREGEITRRNIACPHCGSLKLEILSGKEFMIDSMEVDTDGSEGASSGNGME